MKLIKGNKIINATEKAYKVIYKNLGYKIYENKANREDLSEDKAEADVIDISDITKAEIVEILTEKGIEHNPRDKKEVLYRLMIKGD